MKKISRRFTEKSFDHMADLYKVDPEVFERVKRVEIARVIRSADLRHQIRLRRVQFKIDIAIANNKNDCEEIKRVIRAEIARIINDADPRLQTRLYGLQFKINTTLMKYKDPIACMNKMAELFWEGVSDLDKVLKGDFTVGRNKISAEIIPLFQKIDK